MELEKCPFCGGNAFLWIDPNDVNDGSMNTYHAYCIKCGVRTPEYIVKESVIEAWNRRW